MTQEQTPSCIDRESLFQCYDKIFTLKKFFELMSENQVEMSHAQELVFEIIGRSFSPNSFNRIKNYGEFISAKALNYAFSPENYAYYLDEKCIDNNGSIVAEITRKNLLNAQTVKAITTVLGKKKGHLTMLDRNAFLPNEFTALSETFDDLKKRLYDDTQNLCILAYFLAIYNTYIVGRILSSDVGQRIKELMSDKNVYYTSAKLITMLGKNKTGLCEEDVFWAAADSYQDKRPKDITPKNFNDLQMQKICWTACSFDILSDASDNNLLYILLNLNSSLLAKGHR